MYATTLSIGFYKNEPIIKLTSTKRNPAFVFLKPQQRATAFFAGSHIYGKMKGNDYYANDIKMVWFQI